MPGLRAITIVLALLLARPAAADCDAVRAVLAHDRAQAHAWNLAWGLGFTGASILQVAVAISPAVSDRQRDAMWVGAAKSSIGAVVHAILPLRVREPTSCDDAHAILAKAARDERRLFILNTFGGLALNTAGALILSHYHSWRDGLISLAVGVPVGLFHAYTLPRGSWRMVSGVSVVPANGGGVLALAGTF